MGLCWAYGNPPRSLQFAPQIKIPVFANEQQKSEIIPFRFWDWPQKHLEIIRFSEVSRFVEVYSFSSDSKLAKNWFKLKELDRNDRDHLPTRIPTCCVSQHVLMYIYICIKERNILLIIQKSQGQPPGMVIKRSKEYRKTTFPSTVHFHLHLSDPKGLASRRCLSKASQKNGTNAFWGCEIRNAVERKKLWKSSIKLYVYTSWWLNQPIWKNISHVGSFPGRGEYKNIWNQHLVYDYCWRIWHLQTSAINSKMIGQFQPLGKGMRKEIRRAWEPSERYSSWQYQCVPLLETHSYS